MWLSWKHEVADGDPSPTLEDKVEIFYEQTLGWQLHIADLVANGGLTFEDPNSSESYEVLSIRHSGFAVLHICFSYFEMVGSLLSSKPLRPGDAFRVGVKAVPDAIDTRHATKKILKKLYSRARCGLYHQGRTRYGVGLGQPPDGKAMAYLAGTDMIGISPERLPRVLKAHLESLRQDLLDPAKAKLRERFEERFDAGFSQEWRPRSCWRRMFERS
jgi:hypothetical protein